MDIFRLEADVLVLGGGLAGYRAAIAARECGASVTMAFFARGASPYIIGCNSPIGHADDRDKPEIFFDDMVRGGYGLNDRRLVKIMSTESIDAQRELSELGVQFPVENDRITQRHLSGNTYPRSLFIPDGTGRVILERLSSRVEELGIRVLTGLKVVDLLNDNGDVVGALLWNKRKQEFTAISARAVVLAMGGIGRIYSDSTYPADIGSDSYGLALKHGACLIDMEFVQFEPVVTVWPEACRGMEMPTAMLGDGAHLINANGERFMFRYNPQHGEKQIEKARMALCVQTEIDEGRGLPDGSVIFDTTVLAPERLESYKIHVRRLRSAGVDPLTTPPHVRPASHSQMGGVLIDEHGWSGVPGLYAGGESAGGVHGASRLAGNGCSDTLVFGALAGRGAAAGMLSSKPRNWTVIVDASRRSIADRDNKKGHARVSDIKEEVRHVMLRAAGLWRHQDTLSAGQASLRDLSQIASCDIATGGTDDAIEACELDHMLSTAKMIVEAALIRTESRGAHQRRDFPKQNDADWLKHTGFRKDRAGGFAHQDVPIQ